MTLADLELAFVIARVAYQTEVAEGEPYLVDPDNTRRLYEVPRG